MPTPSILRNDPTHARSATGEITASSCCTKASAVPAPASSSLDPALPVQNTSNDPASTTNATGENTAFSFDKRTHHCPCQHLDLK